MGPDISLGFGQKVSAGGPAAAGGPKAILQYSQAGGTCPYICTAVQLYCIQHYSSTAIQHYSHTAVQHYSITAYSIQHTAVQHYSSTALQHYSITAIQQYSHTALQHYSHSAAYSHTASTALQHTAIRQYLQPYSNTALQQYSSTDIRGPKSYSQYSSTAIQQYRHYSSTAIQQYSSTALQQYRPREKIEDRSTAAVIGYARVSPREQAARGLSLEVQKAQVLAMAMLEDVGPEDVQIREDKQPRRGRGRACSRSCRLSAAGRGSPHILGNATPACMAAWLRAGTVPGSDLDLSPVPTPIDTVSMGGLPMSWHFLIYGFMV